MPSGIIKVLALAALALTTGQHIHHNPCPAEYQPAWLAYPETEQPTIMISACVKPMPDGFTATYMIPFYAEKTAAFGPGDQIVMVSRIQKDGDYLIASKK